MGDFVRRRIFNNYILGLGLNWPVASFPHPGHGERRTIAAALNLGSRFAALQGIGTSRPCRQNVQTGAAWELLQTDGFSCLRKAARSYRRPQQLAKNHTCAGKTWATNRDERTSWQRVRREERKRTMKFLTIWKADVVPRRALKMRRSFCGIRRSASVPPCSQFRGVRSWWRVV